MMAYARSSSSSSKWTHNPIYGPRVGKLMLKVGIPSKKVNNISACWRRWVFVHKAWVRMPVKKWKWPLASLDHHWPSLMTSGRKSSTINLILYFALAAFLYMRYTLFSCNAYSALNLLNKECGAGVVVEQSNPHAQDLRQIPRKMASLPGHQFDGYLMLVMISGRNRNRVDR